MVAALFAASRSRLIVGALLLVALAAAYGYVRVLQADLDAAELGRELEARNTAVALTAAADTRRALAALEAEHRRAEQVLARHRRQSAAIDRRARARDRQVEEATHEPDCDVLRARVCGAVYRVLLGDETAAAGGDGAGGGAGAAAAGAAPALPAAGAGG